MSHFKRIANDDTDPGVSAGDDVIRPFKLEKTDLRGRSVKLGKVLDDILGPHDYPEPVAQLVAETVTLAALLASMLKYEGIFTLQARGDGPVSMIVADMTSEGEIRGCASFHPERLAKMMEGEEHITGLLMRFMGKGHIAFTVDQKDSTESYQGIVELKGVSLVTCVRHYFNQSEQIGTGIKMATGRQDGAWRSGAIMLQHMPEDQKNPEAGFGNAREDDWRRSMILLESCKDAEMLDADLKPDDLLFRLFHEEGVRVFPETSLFKGCRCNPDKVKKVLAALSVEELEELKEDGVITIHCEFCSRDYRLEPGEIKTLVE